jgi:type IV secretion system protein VirB10
VNQNLPPNQPGQSGDYSSGQAANPYYTEPPPGEQPNLDANAPQLKVNESQKINTKALMFLGGIVLLLILLTVLVVMSGGDDEEKQEALPQQEQVVTPERPTSLRDPLDPLAAEPVQADQLPPIPPADPIPVEPTSQQNQANANRDPYGSAPPEGPRGPTLAERRMGAAEGSGYGGGSGGQNEDPVAAMMRSLQGVNPGAAAAQPQAADRVAKVERARYINNADALLVRGTYIRCVLETRIITDLPGFASCIVTEPVYSINGRSLLLPKGSKISGKYAGEPTGPRVAVVWDRVTTPNGIDMTMESPGVDNLGSSGHPGDYNAHWASKISSAIFISLVSDAFKYFGEKEGPETQTVTSGGEVVTQPFESNTAKAVDRLANQAVAKSASRPATVTINQGTVVNIYVSKDVDFSDVVTKR